MKKLTIAALAALSLSACSLPEDEANKIGGVIFGAGAVAICAQTGACAFPL